MVDRTRRMCLEMLEGSQEQKFEKGGRCNLKRLGEQKTRSGHERRFVAIYALQSYGHQPRVRRGGPAVI